MLTAINSQTALSTISLNISEGLIDDILANPSPAVSNIMPTTLIPDEVPPNFENFSFDVNSGVLQLTFSEAVRADNFTSNRVTLQDGVMPDTT